MRCKLPYGSLFELLALGVLAAILVASCGTDSRQSSEEGSSSGGTSEETTEGMTGTASAGKRVEVGDTEVLLCGEGDYGVVMAHGAAYNAASWEKQGQEIAKNGFVALAPEDTSPESLLAAVEYMREELGVRGVALMGGSAGGSAVLRAATQNPEATDQLVLLSATGDVSSLGEEPKLFVASEGEGSAEEVRRMAKEAPGNQNEALILSSDAHAQAIFQTEEGDRLMHAILKRLEEYG